MAISRALALWRIGAFWGDFRAGSYVKDMTTKRNSCGTKKVRLISVKITDLSTEQTTFAPLSMSCTRSLSACLPWQFVLLFARWFWW